ncbi:MAG TPA: tRNA-dihydrouridine synthase family protein [Spirochaetota bacterium]|mgnify:CR=1 FL=1|nr:tRNA-dihydrouridine synthase family protein [Spirochaetota bacterium]
MNTSLLDYTYFLAPMAEITTPALRNLVKHYYSGIVLSSEMMSAAAIVGGAMNNNVFLARYPFDDPYIYQIVGNSPGKMAEACRILSGKGCFSVDINMGCSAPDIVKKNYGAKLLCDIDLAKKIVRECRKACTTRLSVKMRSGYESSDEEYLKKFSRMLQEEGVDFITLHPRFAKLSFRRSADWKLVSLLKRSVNIPVIGNGDIISPEIAAKRITETGCDGIMIGREAVTSPWIFRLCAAIEQNRYDEITIDLLDVWIRVLEDMQRILPLHLQKSRAHRFSFYFSKNTLFSHELFRKIRNADAIPEIIEIVSRYFSETGYNERCVHFTVDAEKIIKTVSPAACTGG